MPGGYFGGLKFWPKEIFGSVKDAWIFVGRDFGGFMVCQPSHILLEAPALCLEPPAQ